MAQELSSRGIVTPEAVLLDFEVAGLASRVLSRLVDAMVLMGGFSLLGVVSSVMLQFAGSVAQTVFAIIATTALFFGYPIVAEVRMQGRTFGHRALGLRVVTNEGGPVGVRHAVIRSLFQLIDVAFGFGVIAGMFTKKTQRLGDLAAGTFVVREPRGGVGSGAVTFPPPPGFERYVASLNVAALTPEQYEVIRSFLIRVNQLSMQARRHLAVQLAGSTTRHLGHAVPPNLDPEIYLVCVVAAYQQRYGGLLVQWTAQGWRLTAAR